MKKILVSDYSLKQLSDAGEEIFYPVKEALAEVLFHPAMKIMALDLLKRDDLTRKIQAWPDDDLLLEEAEYAMVKGAVEKVDTYSRNDVELVRRVLNAETVEVVEKVE